MRRLLRGKALSRFAACLSGIRIFFEIKNLEHPEPSNIKWFRKFYYFVNMTERPNQLNVKMQGIGNTILSLQQAKFAFENKLDFFFANVEIGRRLHFKRLKEFKDACTASDPTQHFHLQQQVGFTFNLLQSFKVRF